MIDLINDICWFTGAFLWSLVILLLLACLGELLWGAACAVSYTRWTLEIVRRRGKSVTRWQMLKFYSTHILDLSGHRNKPDCERIWNSTDKPYQRLGSWRGIGDYTIDIQP
jgi:hypothetical protein